MPVDTYVAAEILATCSALGSEVRGIYQKSSDCLNCLKDLILYLRRDDEDHSVLRQLGDLKLLQTDLLPILKQHSKCKDIFDMTLRLLIVITNPAFLLYKEEIPEDKLARNVYNSLIGYLQNYKQAFTDVEVWNVLRDSLKLLLSVGNEDRDEDDRLAIERILIIMRNILHVPPNDSDEKRTDDDASLHDQVLWAIHLSKMEDLILYLSQNDEEHQYCLHVLEIISLILREQTPAMLVAAGKTRSVSEKADDEKKLMTSRRKEYEQRMDRHKHLTTQRFNGVYCVKNMKSISDREYISHKLLTTLDNIKFDTDKAGKRIPKNKLPVKDGTITRRSTLSICLFLKEFCNDIINNSYNGLMSSVKRTLMNKKSEDHDDSYYLWAIQYFLEFNRLGKFQLDAVSETVSVHTFHFIQTEIDSFYETMLADKKKVKYWSRRMHLALKAYKELLETLYIMSSSTESSIKTCADVIKSNIFYVNEYRELLLGLLMNYDELRFSLSYLVDLIQATHLFLKMLQQYSKGHSQIIVQKKKRKRSKKKKVPKRNLTIEQHEQNQAFQNWDDICDDLSSVLQGHGQIPTDIIPFDATSPLNFEEQKTEVVFKIREAMVAKETGKSVALLRAARDLWSEDDAFGAPNVKPEEEFLILREIFLANLPTRDTAPANADENIEEEEESEEENEELQEYIAPEQQLDIMDFCKRFASPKVVRSCCLLLANYKQNSTATNTCLVKLMHRIAWDYKMHALFFQASTFVTFKKILHDTDQKYEPSIKELARFAKFIISNFFQSIDSNRKILVEMLFWKGAKEAYELDEGYGTYLPSSRPSKPKKRKKKTAATVSQDQSDNEETMATRTDEHFETLFPDSTFRSETTFGDGSLHEAQSTDVFHGHQSDNIIDSSDEDMTEPLLSKEYASDKEARKDATSPKSSSFPLSEDASTFPSTSEIQPPNNSLDCESGNLVNSEDE